MDADDRIDRPFSCDGCGMLVLPRRMRMERMILPGGVDWAGHERCVPEGQANGGRMASWMVTPDDGTRAERWAREHEGRPALALTRAHDAFTHRAHDRRPETPANPAPVRRGVTEASIMTRDQEARDLLMLERERTLVDTPVCDDAPSSRAPFWSEAAVLIRSLEHGEALVRLRYGDDAVQRRKVALVAAYHDKAGRLLAIRVATRDARREVTFTDTGEMIREDTPPMQTQLSRRIAKSGAWTRTVYARTPDWTGDDLKGDGFVHLATHVLTTSDV